MDDKKYRVLVVDDEPRILRSIEDLLDDEFSVFSYEDPEEALRFLGGDTDVSVVITDQRMPQLKGHEFLSAVKKISRATRILVTGYADISAIVQAVNDGNIYGFLSKPWEPAAFKLMVLRGAEFWEALQKVESEQRLLHLLMDNIPDPIFFKDEQLRFTRFNGAQAEKYCFTDAAEALGKTLSQISSFDNVLETEKDERKIIKSGKPVINRTERIETSNLEDSWLLTTKVPIKDNSEGVIGLVGISRDITNLKNAEEKLKLTVQQLARSCEELERFAFIASHHLNEPLRQVGCFIALLAKKYPEHFDEKAERYFNFVLGGVDRMRAMVQDLGLYYRIITDRHDEVEVDLKALVDRVVHDMATIIEKTKATIEYKKLPKVVADGKYIKVALQNIMDNSIKFNEQAHPHIHISAKKKGQQWVIAIKDNGIGVDSGYFDRIFEVFQKLHPISQYPGTGMGLSISRRIIESTNGRIWLESQIEKGSTFYLSFPIRNNGKRPIKKS